MIGSLEGMGLGSILSQAKPNFVWDALGGNIALGSGLEGLGHTQVSLVDDDSITTTEPFTVWDAGNERFKQVTPDANPREVLGSAGQFLDGVLQQRWPSAWDAATLGFAVVAPTDAGQLTQAGGVYPDILSGCTHGDVTVVDTDSDAVNDAIIERSVTNSASYKRVFQVLVKSEDDLDAEGNVYLGLNGSADTRTVSTDTWCRKLPGSRGWWACGYIVAAGAGTSYASISFPADTGRWFVAAPLWYSTWSTMENVTRAPIPVETGPTTYKRGLWWAETTNAEIALRPCGWLGMSVVLPDRSVSNGHKDYSGNANYRFLGLLNLVCDSYRLRVNMSDTYDYLTVSLGTTVPVNFAFLDIDLSWEEFGGFGIVVTWGISNGSTYVYLYVNGNKVDSVVNPGDWYPNNLSAAKLYMGISEDSGTSGECFISRVAIGNQSLHRSYARTLSSRMYDLARGKI